MIARSSISIHQAIFAPCRRCDEVVRMTGMELGGIGDGLKWLEEHCESAQLTRSAAVQYRCSVTQQTARVIRLFRYQVYDVVLKIRRRIADGICCVVERTDKVNTVVKIDFYRQTVTTQLKRRIGCIPVHGCQQNCLSLKHHTDKDEDDGRVQQC